MNIFFTKNDVIRKIILKIHFLYISKLQNLKRILMIQKKMIYNELEIN
jgi:hypothetical protein